MGGLFFLNNKQQLEYLLRIRKIREVMVVKDNIHLTYKYKNRNQAFKQVENLQDKIINHVIDDVLFGNVGELKNIEKTTSKIINDTLVNERKRIHRIDDRFINHAVKSNTEIYSKFFNNRLNNIKYSLQLRIEEELRKNSIRNLSDSEIRKILSEKYADTGKARLKNIVKDSIHTNESNISFIQALNEGYSYKVWMNGRSKGKTRPWHRARIIASVPIDEYFDIYGSYHAEMMYPGDLNGGAENVANCRCWLRYTNRTPSNLKNKSSFNIPSTSYLHGKNNGGIKQNALKVTSKIGNKITRTISTIGNKIKNTGSKITEKVKQTKYNIDYSLENERPSKNKFKNKKIHVRNNSISIKRYEEFNVLKEHPFLSNKQLDFIYNHINRMCKQYISNIRLLPAKKNKNGRYVGGSVKVGSSKILIREVPNKHFTDYIKTIHHEAGHILDHTIHNKYWGISNSDEWKEAFKLDKKHNIKLNNKRNEQNNYFVSDYAKRKAEEHINNGRLKQMYAEDFAVSIGRYLDSQDYKFKEEFPNRCEVIEKYLNGG